MLQAALQGTRREHLQEETPFCFAVTCGGQLTCHRWVTHRGAGGWTGTESSEISRESCSPEEWAPRALGKDEDNPQTSRENVTGAELEAACRSTRRPEEGHVQSSPGTRRGVIGGEAEARRRSVSSEGWPWSRSLTGCGDLQGARLQSRPASLRLRLGTGGHPDTAVGTSISREREPANHMNPWRRPGVWWSCVHRACVSDVLCTLPTSIQIFKFGLRCAQWRKEIWAETRTINGYSVSLCSWPLCVCRGLILPNP